MNVLSQVLPGSEPEPGLRKDEDNKDPVIQAFAGLTNANQRKERWTGRPTKSCSLFPDSFLPCSLIPARPA